MFSKWFDLTLVIAGAVVVVGYLGILGRIFHNRTYRRIFNWWLLSKRGGLKFFALVHGIVLWVIGGICYTTMPGDLTVACCALILLMLSYRVSAFVLSAVKRIPFYGQLLILCGGGALVLSNFEFAPFVLCYCIISFTSTFWVEEDIKTAAKEQTVFDDYEDVTEDTVTDDAEHEEKGDNKNILHFK